MSSEYDARILIVDDDREQARALKMSLELMEQQIQVVDVPSGEEAMLEIGRDPFDLLVADFHLPGMTGVELLEKTLDKYPDIIRMILTAYTDEKLLLDAINRVHVHGYINKPWEPQEIIDIVRQGLEAHGAIPIPDIHIAGRTSHVLK